MIQADDFLGPLRDAGHSFVSGVPCSFLKPFINRVIDSPDLDYLGATSEGEAVGITFGAYLAGRKTVTLCQNSGLGNMVNPLTSLNYPFAVPTLLITTWRGEPGVPDEPQHVLMGQITQEMLETLRIPWRPFPASAEAVQPALEEATASMRTHSLPFAFVMRKGTVASTDLLTRGNSTPCQSRDLTEDRSAPPSLPTRAEALETVLDVLPSSAALIATTGKTGRELFTLSDQPQNLYVVGGMGTASAIGLGVAINAPQRPVVVLDGDGAALMKLGSFATIGSTAPENLLHLVLDNGVHDSTGGQATVSSTVSFAGIAAAANYRHVAEAGSLEEFRSCLQQMIELPGPSLLHLRIRPGSMENLGRPTVTPVEVRDRFMAFLRSDVAT